MNKKGSLFKTYMIRPVLYKCVTRAALAVTALLLWDRFINTAGRFSLLRDGCLTAGLLFFLYGLVFLSPSGRGNNPPYAGGAEEKEAGEKKLYGHCGFCR